MSGKPRPDDNRPGGTYGGRIEIPPENARNWDLAQELFRSTGKYDSAMVIGKFSYNPATGEMFIAPISESHAHTIRLMRRRGVTESDFEELVRGIAFYETTKELGEGGGLIVSRELETVCLRRYSPDEGENRSALHATELVLREHCGVEAAVRFIHDAGNEVLIRESAAVGEGRTTW